MANSASVNSLVLIVRARLNLQNLNTISDADIKTFIKSSLASLYEKIANKHRDYYVKSIKMSLASGTDTYPLPLDFRSAVQVYLTQGSGSTISRIPLEIFTMNKYQTQLQSGMLTPQWPTMYRIMALNILFTPAPSANYTNAIEFWYVPQWVAPVSDDGTIDAQMPNGWETWVEYDTCVQVAMRLRLAEYYAMYSKERDSALADIMKAVVIRDESPQYMTDSFDIPWIGLNLPGEA